MPGDWQATCPACQKTYHKYKRPRTLTGYRPFPGDDAVSAAVNHLTHPVPRFDDVVPELRIPPELEKDVTVLDLPLPGAPELQALLTSMLASLPSSRVQIDPSPELLERVIKATLGLTETEAENIFAKAIVSDSKFSEDDLPLIIAEKKQILRKTGLLESYDLGESLSSIRKVAKVRKNAVTPETIVGVVQELHHAYSFRPEVYRFVGIGEDVLRPAGVLADASKRRSKPKA